jgi:hypothetical protein
MLIELSQFNSSSVFSSSDWTNTISPLVIKPQGTLTFKGGFLDYATTSQIVIELPQDTEVSIKVGFYMAAPPVNATDGTGPLFTSSQSNGQIYINDITEYQAFDLYVARDHSGDEPTYPLITSTKTFTIPAGNYSPDEISEIINVNCIRVPYNLHGSGCDFNNSENSSFFRSTTLDMLTCALEPFIGTTHTGKQAVLKARDITQLANFNIGDEVSLYDLIPGTGFDQTFNYRRVIETIDRKTGIITLDPQPDRPQETLLNLYMYKNIYSDDPLNTDNCVRFYRQANNSKPFDPDVFFRWAPEDARKTYMMGASQFQLEYNYNNNSLFQFTYLHTPYYDGDTEAINYYFAGYPFNNIFAFTNTITGVFINDLQPQSFWSDILGFRYNDLVVKNNPVNNYLSAPLRCGLNITGNLVATDALFSKTSVPQQQPPGASDGGDPGGYRSLQVKTASSQTSPIVALKTQGVTTSPFYLIEIGGLSDVNMVNDRNVFRTICAFGSKEYSNAGIISIYADGTSFYTNNGVSDVILSSFRVRILDSLTKIPSTNLGTRNTILLQLDNPSIPPPMPQPEPEKKEKK